MFEDSLVFVFEREGGFVDHPADKGGATNKGVTQSMYDKWRSRMILPVRSVKEIGNSEVEAIYHRHYWIDGKCDDIDETHSFDACVNHGLNRAAKMLERLMERLDRRRWGH